GARHCRLAADETERKKLWAARKGAFGAMGRIAPDMMLQDAVVPRSRLPGVLADTYRIGAKYRLRIANVFHAGDGNLHPFISFDSRDADEVARVKEAGREIMETCVRAGGTITGEHGVGLDKSAYLPLIFSPEDLGAMLRVRAAFDPTNLCNPGKIIPLLKGCGEGRVVVSNNRRQQHIDGETARAIETAEAGREAVEATHANAPRLMQPDSLTTNTTQTPRTSQHGPRPLTIERVGNSLADIVGPEHVETRDESRGAFVVSPASIEEACEVLRVAGMSRFNIVPAGAETWMDAGDPLRACDSQIVLRTTRMARIVEHEPADLVVTAEAGVTLDALNRQVGEAGQWLALDSPDEGGRVTLGGVAATGLGGAQGYVYGTPRAHVLGMTVALAGGERVRVGGRVVKNVAGYDLCKLFTGSYGTLGLILELTFKLRPRPASTVTVFAKSTEPGALLNAARKLAFARLAPVALEILSQRAAATTGVPDAAFEGHTLLARFAGTREIVEHQSAHAREIFREELKHGEVEMFEDDVCVWSKLAALTLQHKSKLVWRAGVRQGDLGGLLAEVGRLYGAPQNSLWHASVYSGRLRFFDQTDEDIAVAVARLLSLRGYAQELNGSLVIEHALDEVRRSMDAWGIKPASAALMRRVKEQLDPGDVFSPGRFASVSEGGNERG
ncbi:MAG: FAD-linked oxidase C-terminal domain-containing protein, partial [Pyrinomonadaceae bacterium]